MTDNGYRYTQVQTVYPNYRLVQRARSQQEREMSQLMTDPFIQSFQYWGSDLIGILPKTARGNRWIVTAVDYAID
jgi:hypothetical protein